MKDRNNELFSAKPDAEPIESVRDLRIESCLVRLEAVAKDTPNDLNSDVLSINADTNEIESVKDRYNELFSARLVEDPIEELKLTV